MCLISSPAPSLSFPLFSFFFFFPIKNPNFFVLLKTCILFCVLVNIIYYLLFIIYYLLFSFNFFYCIICLVLISPDLKDVLTREVGDLSGGELQRFAIAMACVQSADVYMFDEPSSYLDVKQRLNAARTIRALLAANK